MQKEFLEDIECPICLEIPKNEIFQCANGHSYCGSCSVKIEVCPQCRIIFTGIRNRAMESLLDKIKFDCVNKIFGCQTRNNRQQILAHQSHCTFG